MTMRILALLAAALLVAAPAPSQSPSGGNPALDKRGTEGMGFDQTKTTHHFLLTRTGGIIRADANSSGDSKNIDAIRTHMQYISRAFAEGNFNIPMFVHDRVPPGVPAMKRLKGEIRYSYRSTANGGEVVIRSSNPPAVSAIHDFLLFQITDHRTGDPLEVR